MKRIVYIDAHATSEHGDSPIYGWFEADEAILKKLKKLQQICVENNLSEVRQFNSIVSWKPGDFEDEYRLQQPELVVTGKDFWFSSTVKHADFLVETEMLNIDKFIVDVDKSALNEELFYGDDLQEAIEGLKANTPESDGSH